MEGSIVFNPNENFEYNNVICHTYRSLYPEPFEDILKLYGNNINLEIFFSYRDKYDVIDYIYKNKLNKYQTKIIEDDLNVAIKEIILIEKNKLKK
jgi:hypothetical protein